jgi:hypothetical protein
MESSKRGSVRFGRRLGFCGVAIAALVSCGLLLAQAQSTAPQNLPDAPSAQKPQFPLPNPTVPSRPVPGTAPASDPPSPAPNSQVKTVPPGGETKEPGSGRDDLYTLTKRVNFVFVPVSVKTTDNRLMYGLVQQNFSVYENGERQRVTFFTSDPFPISAAVVVDLGMADVAVKRVEETLGALNGAFSEFDEVAYYTYSNTVKKQQEFVAATSPQATLGLSRLKEKQGRGTDHQWASRRPGQPEYHRRADLEHQDAGALARSERCHSACGTRSE